MARDPGRFVRPALFALVLLSYPFLGEWVMTHSPVAFVLLGFVSAGVFVLLAVLARRTAVRIVLVNLGVLVFLLGAAEGYLWLQGNAVYPLRYIVGDEIRGYAPAKNVQVSVPSYHGLRAIYRATYTIDSLGLRVSPPSSGPSPDSSAIFFGCSVTFGEGLDDAYPMPYRVAQMAGGKVRVYNFGFHGYGPHQMLSSLQQGLVEDLVEEPPRLIVYQAIPAHALRSAGAVPWDRHGPRFRIDDSGELRSAGHFDDERKGWQLRVDRVYRSLLFNRLFFKYRTPTEDDIRLYLAIVTAAADYCAERFPGSRFHVLLWNGWKGNPTFIAIRDGLIAAGIQVHTVEQFLPEYLGDPGPFEIDPKDLHPNQRADDLIARYVVSEILR